MDVKKKIKGLDSYVNNPVASKPVDNNPGSVNESTKSDGIDATPDDVKGAVKKLKESVNSAKESTTKMYDLSNEVANAYLNEDGTPKDFSDRKGREVMSENIISNTQVLEKMEENFTKFKEELLNSIPDHIEAHLCKKHENLLNKFYDHRMCYIGLLVFMFFLAGGLGIGFFIKFYECNKKEQEYNALYQKVQTTENANKEAVDFGNYMRDNNPRTYKRWLEKRENAFD